MGRSYSLANLGRFQSNALPWMDWSYPLPHLGDAGRASVQIFDFLVLGSRCFLPVVLDNVGGRRLASLWSCVVLGVVCVSSADWVSEDRAGHQEIHQFVVH